MNLRFAAVAAALNCVYAAPYIGMKTNWTIINYEYAFATGPFDLSQVTSAAVGGLSQIQCGAQSGNGFVCPKGITGSIAMQTNPQSGHFQYGRFKTGNIPVWVIYFGNSHTTTQKSLIENFVGNIADNSKNPYWQTVMNYNYPGKGFGGNPYLGGTYKYDCTKYRTNNRYCDIQAWDEDELLTQMFNGFIDDWTGYSCRPYIPVLPYSATNIYLFVGGTDTSYTSIYNGGSSMLGAPGSSLCGRKDIQALNNIYGYQASYIYTQITQSASHWGGVSDSCNIIAPVNSPNNDLVDNTILIILHELVESVLSTQSYDPTNGQHFDSFYNNCGVNAGQSGWGPADVCGHLITNLVPTGTGNYFNLALNGQKYTVSPVWDNNALSCSMGTNPTLGDHC